MKMLPVSKVGIPYAIEGNPKLSSTAGMTLTSTNGKRIAKRIPAGISTKNRRIKEYSFSAHI
jgi:hypothetical protein